jgi:glycerol-1-phosphate dehydrogenase [NAD(P)+]
MTSAGYADVVGKITAGADWIIADTLGAERIDPVSWDLVHGGLRGWISQPEDLLGGDVDVLARVFEGLTMCGLAMQAMKSSRPASGTEHLFSHYWEMHHLEHDGVPVSHGFKVAIGSFAATALMEVLFSREAENIDIEERLDNWPTPEQRIAEVKAHFEGKPMIEQVVAASLSKHLTRAQLKERLETVRSCWRPMRTKVQEQLVSYSELRGMLRTAGCPTEPRHIGLTEESVRDTFPKAQMIRPRYTALDLAYELGWLDECVEEIFSSRNYFG